MDTLATCLPLLTGQALPQMMQPDDVQALSGAEFLQMLTSLGTAAAAGRCRRIRRCRRLPTELNMAEIKPPRDEPDVPAEAAMALQWLPLTQFIETRHQPEIRGCGARLLRPRVANPALLQTAAAASVAACGARFDQRAGRSARACRSRSTANRDVICLRQMPPDEESFRRRQRSQRRWWTPNPPALRRELA